jgi:COMPASS component SPP1
MIGCDGECEDWFHGRCVNMRQEDADLVDKYICKCLKVRATIVVFANELPRSELCRQGYRRHLVETNVPSRRLP